MRRAGVLFVVALLFAVSVRADMVPRSSTRAVRIPFMFSGVVGGSAIASIPCTDTFTFPANFVGSTPDANSLQSCKTGPSSGDSYVLKVAGSTIGTITLQTGCTAPTNTGFPTVAGFTCTAGQLMEIDGPATTNGEVNVTFVIAGHAS